MTLALEAVGKRFGATVALDRVTLQVPGGRRLAVVGPSGCGKTTLLRVIAGFEAPDTGTVRLDGAVLGGRGVSVPTHRRAVGIVAQDGALFPHLSVRDNIGFGLPRRAPGRDARLRELMALVDLDPALLPRAPDSLSGGQQQRVALARALARQPKLMLLDEPFSALDTGLRVQTRRAVARVLEAAGVTAVLVTHDQAEAMSFAHEVAVMRAGRLLQVAAPEALWTRPADREVAEFLGDALILPAVAQAGVAECALGRVALLDPAAVGPLSLMLRPGQVTLVPAPPGHASGQQGRVVGVDFAGNACSYALCVDGLAEPIQVLQARTPGIAVGTAVAIALQGPAHAFPPANPAAA